MYHDVHIYKSGNNRVRKESKSTESPCALQTKATIEVQ